MSCEHALPGDPPQPCAGPGGADYLEGQQVRVEEFTVADAVKYWLYTPELEVFSPPRVLVYLHGAGLSDPMYFAAMLEHFARKGYTVVFPISSGVLAILPDHTSVEVAVRDVMPKLATGARLAFAGHSLGAMHVLLAAITANTDASVPLPEVVVLHDAAGYTYFPDLPQTAGQLNTRLLLIQAETTYENADPNAYSEMLWMQTAGLTHARNYLVVPSDDAGAAALLSDHAGVTVGPDVADATKTQPLDAIDWYGYWRPTEGALAEAFGEAFPGYSAFCVEAGPACDPVRDMGAFASGAAVAKIRNAAELSRLAP